MFSVEIVKLRLSNRLARLEANGKDNFSVRKKIKRQLNKM